MRLNVSRVNRAPSGTDAAVHCREDLSLKLELKGNAASSAVPKNGSNRASLIGPNYTRRSVYVQLKRQTGGNETDFCVKIVMKKKTVCELCAVEIFVRSTLARNLPSSFGGVLPPIRSFFWNHLSSRICYASH